MITIIGHRGAMEFAPANTLTSFRKALELKADMVELDVHLTKDGEAAVIHEAYVDETTDGEGMVNEMTMEEIKKLNVKGEEKIPALQEVIDMVKGKAEINIEIKDPLALKRAIEIVEKNDMEDSVIISSFIQDIVEESKNLNSKIRTALLFVNPDIEFLEYAKNIGVFALHTNHNMTDQELIEKAHQFGLKVHAWGADDAESFHHMVDLGVDGIITNNPGLRGE